MEGPLLAAGKTFDTERDNAAKEKAALTSQRNRLEGEIYTIKNNIDEMEMESSRESSRAQHSLWHTQLCKKKLI